jgi:hypothetical protein
MRAYFRCDELRESSGGDVVTALLGEGQQKLLGVRHRRRRIAVHVNMKNDRIRSNGRKYARCRRRPFAKRRIVEPCAMLQQLEFEFN